MKQHVLRLLGIYQDYRALRPDVCRFHPTCSHYASEAVTEHGVTKGAWLAFRRVLRCNPFGSYGYDPVPQPMLTASRGPQVDAVRANAVRKQRV